MFVSAALRQLEDLCQRIKKRLMYATQQYLFTIGTQFVELFYESVVSFDYKCVVAFLNSARSNRVACGRPRSHNTSAACRI